MTDTEQILRLMTNRQAKAWGLILDGARQYEIAEKMGISQAAVSQLKKRGRRRVKKCKDLLRNG